MINGNGSSEECGEKAVRFERFGSKCNQCNIMHWSKIKTISCSALTLNRAADGTFRMCRN